MLGDAPTAHEVFIERANRTMLPGPADVYFEKVIYLLGEPDADPPTGPERPADGTARSGRRNAFAVGSQD
jgi:hypothetical protein